MSTSNPNYGVGGTAKDGGVSTAATVADGGPTGKKMDPTYEPPPSASTRSKTEAHEGNPTYGVGGTAKDGGMSTAATVSDGGPNDAEPDSEYKPS